MFMITVVLLVFGFVGIALGAVLTIAALLTVYSWVGRKLTRLILTFQGHRHDPLDGFRIADEYPPKPQGQSRLR